MKGWRYESYRHSLAARGIRTSLKTKSRMNFIPFGWGSKKHIAWVRENNPEGLPDLLRKIKERKDKAKGTVFEKKKRREALIKEVGIEEVKRREENEVRERLLRVLSDEFPNIGINVPIIIIDEEVGKKPVEVEEESEYEDDPIEGINFSSKRKSFTLTEDQLDKLESIEEKIGNEIAKPDTDFVKIRQLREEMREVIQE